MKIEKEFTQAIKIVESLIKASPYDVEECKRIRKGKACSKCTRVIKAIEFLNNKDK
jgi:hypothetical protein